MRLLTPLAFAAILVGCATSSRINAVNIGMSKAQVIAVMGDPVSVSAKGRTEYLNYELSETSDDAFHGMTTSYYVRLENGKVDSYGRTGDFDNTRPTAVALDIDKNASSDEDSNLVRYECYTYVGSNHVLTLPVPDVDADIHLVEIAFHSDTIPTIYQRSGLTQIWMLEEDLYIQVDPDFVARYMDFRGAEEGERRQAEAVFECRKRN